MLTESTARTAIGSALRRAAVRATLAPSVHNTQPWRFVLEPRSLEIHADRSRQLGVLDPSGRQLLISCGCAVMNARVALSALGYAPVVEYFPEPTHPSLLARISVGESDGPATELGALDAMVDVRRTNRRHFASDPVPGALIETLVAAATVEHSVLVPIVRDEDRLATAIWSQKADAQQNSDPAYRSELRLWTSDDPGREDGVPATAVPHSGADAHDDVPIRDFDSSGTGGLPAETGSGLNQCLLLLGTAEDNALAWLRAGEALERVLLEVSRHGFVASLFTQVVEVPYTREMLRHDLRLAMHPHVLLRVGRAALTPAPRRRRLVSMLIDNN